MATTLNVALNAATLGRYVWLEVRVRRGVFRNWARGFRYAPERFVEPVTEHEIGEVVRSSRKVRVFGSGHSFNAGVVSDGTLLSLDNYSGPAQADPVGERGYRSRNQVLAVKGGTRVRDVVRLLLNRGLAFEALPSHDAQSIAGILSTDVHGTGAKWGFVSDSVVGLKLIDGKGDVHECEPSDDLFKAAVGGVGAVGLITEVAVEGVPRFNVAQREASASTIWRWLSEDAIKPWQVRSWIFRRDPDFRAKAGRVLDLYARRFEGRLLHPGEFVVSADEKSQLQALGRRHATVAGAPGHPVRCEFEYRRHGTLAYLAAWDVHHARLFDRVEERTGIEPFGRLVSQVMDAEPYASAKRVFWVVDNGSSHAGQASIERLEGAYRNLRLIHLPVHASWLNQVELYFSIVQRKALTPNDFDSLEALGERLLAFGHRYREVARPFEWTFTRASLERVLERVEAQAARGEGRRAHLRLAA